MYGRQKMEAIFLRELFVISSCRISHTSLANISRDTVIIKKRNSILVFVASVQQPKAQQGLNNVGLTIRYFFQQGCLLHIIKTINKAIVLLNKTLYHFRTKLMRI